MEVRHRHIDDVTVLDLKGKMTLGEGDELLKDCIARHLASGRRKILLNLADVPYIDSAGKGEIVRTYTTVSRSGGKLKLLNLTKRITDLLTVTKLLTVFETFDDEREALDSFGIVKPSGVCPVCQHRAAFVSTCANCLAQFEVVAGAPNVIVREIRLPTYEGEFVRLISGMPFAITIRSRLDLFAAEAVEQAWRTVPRPRKILIELGAECGFVTAKALGRLVALCKPEPDGGRTSVWHAELPAAVGKTIPPAPPFFPDRSAALAALGAHDDTRGAPIVIRLDG